MGNVYDLILKRRTIRKFKQEIITRDILECIVNAGRIAPSAANLQPLEYVIVNDKKLLEIVFSTLKWAGYIAPNGNPKDGEKPVAYIVVVINRNIKEHGAHHDSGASIENMTLTALEEGIGSCWIASIDREKLRNVLNIPTHYDIDSVVALGYADEGPIMEEMNDSIKYWKDENGVLHVPKRKLSDVLHWNKL